MDHTIRYCHAALSSLIVLQTIMLASLFANSAPHPPQTIPLFAMGPFLAASISVAIAAYILGGANSRAGNIFSFLAAVMALISYGPQKWFDPPISLIWPAILVGEIAAIVILYRVYLASRRRRSS